MAATLSIRPGGAADIPAVVEIWRRSVTVTHHFLSALDIIMLEPEVRSGMGAVELWIAREGDKPVGFMAMNGDMIEALFIDPDHAGKGLGSRFIRHARELRGREVPLRVDVNEDNPNAAAFYRAKGFVQVGRSDTDGAGRPWPLLHLELPGEGGSAG